MTAMTAMTASQQFAVTSTRNAAEQQPFLKRRAAVCLPPAPTCALTPKRAPPLKMAGASSLQDDILALVKKHSDTCLPEDLLARVSEDARLLAAKMKIRCVWGEWDE